MGDDSPGQSSQDEPRLRVSVDDDAGPGAAPNLWERAVTALREFQTGPKIAVGAGIAIVVAILTGLPGLISSLFEDDQAIGQDADYPLVFSARHNRVEYLDVWLDGAMPQPSSWPTFGANYDDWYEMLEDEAGVVDNPRWSRLTVENVADTSATLVDSSYDIIECTTAGDSPHVFGGLDGEVQVIALSYDLDAATAAPFEASDPDDSVSAGNFDGQSPYFDTNVIVLAPGETITIDTFVHVGPGRDCTYALEFIVEFGGERVEYRINDDDRPFRVSGGQPDADRYEYAFWLCTVQVRVAQQSGQATEVETVGKLDETYAFSSSAGRWVELSGFSKYRDYILAEDGPDMCGEYDDSAGRYLLIDPLVDGVPALTTTTTVVADVSSDPHVAETNPEPVDQGEEDAGPSDDDRPTQYEVTRDLMIRAGGSEEEALCVVDQVFGDGDPNRFVLFTSEILPAAERCGISIETLREVILSGLPDD